MKKFLLAPDSFKGTMEAKTVCDIWEKAILEYHPDANIVKIPIADGGEGFTQAYMDITGGE